MKTRRRSRPDRKTVEIRRLRERIKTLEEYRDRLLSAVSFALGVGETLVKMSSFGAYAEPLVQRAKAALPYGWR
jgi:hypothetical protein